MHGANIGIGARLRGGVVPGLIGIEGFGVERPIRGRGGVRIFIGIDKLHGLSHGDRQACRLKLEIMNFDCGIDCI